MTDKEFDPELYKYLLPGGLQPSPSQVRHMYIMKMAVAEFKNEDQLVLVTPQSGPEALKRIPALKAAEMIFDKKARLATEEEKVKFDTENELAQQRIQKELAKMDLGKAIQRLRD